MWHFVGTEIVRGGNAVSRRGPGSGTGRGLARRAPVGTCPGTRGLECQGAAALYRAALLELQCGLPPTARVSGVSRPDCPPRPEVRRALSGAASRRRAPRHQCAPTRLLPAPSAGQGCDVNIEGTPLQTSGTAS